MLHAILIASALLAVGLALRMKVKPIRVLYLPASVVAGIVGFALVQTLMRIPAAHDMTSAISGEWYGWAGTLISVVFAALLLDQSGEGDGIRAAIRRGARSGIVAWIIILGQLIIGAVVYTIAVAPMTKDVPATFSQMLEASWAGGHGTSAGMAAVFESQGWSAGKDVAFFLATVGLIYGVISGLILVNLAIRRGWTAKPAAILPDAKASDSASDQKRETGGAGMSEAIGSMTLQALILGCAFAVGVMMQWGVQQAAEVIFGHADPEIAKRAIAAIGNLPLFLFTLLGGGVVRYAMGMLRITHLIDVKLLRGIVGVAMDYLIVAAVASMRMEALKTFIVPITLLVVLAGAWSTFCLLVISRQLLPKDYWFELGLLNYGFSTANTPQGFMLLRIIDPELRTRAAEDYAVAAPLSAPFVGGGILTFALFPILFVQWGAIATAGLCAAGIVIFYLIGRSLAHDQAP